MPAVLWWGRCDRSYSRNKIIAKLFVDLGWVSTYYHPVASRTGLIEAYLRRLQKPDLIWVPCFRHRDILSASHWAKKWDIPLVIDPLISAYEKEVFEREKWPSGSRPAEKRLRYETDLFSAADMVVADTPAHAAFFQEILQVEKNRLSVLYVGAEKGLFEPAPYPESQSSIEILFYGSFLQLQGVDVIVNAAQKTRDLNVKWVLLGEGALKAEIEKSSRGLENISFEPWVEYRRLWERIAAAHILLGIFGTTLKADLVIPNKMFQAMAVGRPVITRRAKAYPQGLKTSDVIGWVPAGDADTLADLVRQWIKTPAALKTRGAETRRLFDDFFNENKLKDQLQNILKKVVKNRTSPD